MKEETADSYLQRFRTFVDDVRQLGYGPLKVFSVAVTASTDRLPYLSKASGVLRTPENTHQQVEPSQMNPSWSCAARAGCVLIVFNGAQCGTCSSKKRQEARRGGMLV